MGEWGDWEENCTRDANEHGSCVECKRIRKRPVAKECEQGGDCSCEEETQDRQDTKCGKKLIIFKTQ